MLENFQLAAIVKQGKDHRIFRIPLHQELQSYLAQTWYEQYRSFVDDIQEIAFNAGYTPSDHECFSLRDYDLPAWLREEDIHSVANLDSIANNDAMLNATKGVLAFARSDQGDELVLFQHFSLSHVIRPGSFLFLKGDTYETTSRPGLSLKGKLNAIFFPMDRRLMFQNFRNTNAFLPLSDFYAEVSEEQIRAILAHDRIHPENTDALATGANQWFRKRFAMLRDSGILDKYTVLEITERSLGHDLVIKIVEDRILFPADRNQAKRLLQFLNEEIFRGAITSTLYETNSKREAER